MGHENWRSDDPFERGIRRFTWAVMILVFIVVVAVLGIGGWAAVQLVQWLVTK